MVEDEKTTGNHEDHLGQFQFIALRCRNFGFEEMDRFVAEETNGATTESGQVWRRHKLIACHQIANLIQSVACPFDSPLFAQLGDLQLVPVDFYHHPRIGPDEGETSGLIVFFSRFEQETVTAAAV